MPNARRPYFEIANPEIPEVLSRLPRNLKVLDVGCGSGMHGAELARTLQHKVTGVDLSAPSIEKAKKRLAAAYVGDVTAPERYPFFGRERFDILVFSDMLEHLSDPLDVLNRHLALLAPGGHVVISIPNIAIWNVRMALFFGRFNYTDTGTLDRTHLRFFTRRSLAELVNQAGLSVVGKRITPGMARPFVPLVKKIYGSPAASDGDSASIMESAPYRAYLKWLYPLERLLCGIRPQLLAFQFVLLAQPKAEHAVSADQAKRLAS